MISPGFRSLGAFNITTAGTQVGEWVEGFEGLETLLAQMRLVYGSGGATVRAYLQTSADQGNTPIDIWCRLFGTASESADRGFNSSDTDFGEIIPTDGALADNTKVFGVVGDRFRVKIVSTGTYASSTQLIAGVIAS